MSGGQFPNNLPTLRAALKLSGPLGMCFHRAYAMCLDLPGSKLCIGTFKPGTPEECAADPRVSDVPFLHAWVEWKGKAFAPTTLERTGGEFYAMDPQSYYRVNGARQIRKLSRPTVKAITDEAIRDQLLHGKRPPVDGYLVARLLQAAKIPHKVVDDGGVLPASGDDE